ncbi:hypothetical protein NC651_032910 [Populus alba x Populus x berolinensis]|nr:hypothetical protein NC651_032910 [Populus alba x Populus x berolinensis]
MSRVPVWVRFPNLPLCYWSPSCLSPSCLSKIASVLGKPIQSDHMTSTLSRLSYAHVLVEIDLREDLQHFVEISLLSGPTLYQKAIYKALPKFYNYCNVIGNTRLLCSKAAASAVEAMVKAPNELVGKGSVFGRLGPQILPTPTGEKEKSNFPLATGPSMDPIETVIQDNKLAPCVTFEDWITVKPRQKSNKHIRGNTKGKEVIAAEVRSDVNPCT